MCWHRRLFRMLWAVAKYVKPHPQRMKVASRAQSHLFLRKATWKSCKATHIGQLSIQALKPPAWYCFLDCTPNRQTLTPDLAEMKVWATPQPLVRAELQFMYACPTDFRDAVACLIGLRFPAVACCSSFECFKPFFCCIEAPYTCHTPCHISVHQACLLQILSVEYSYVHRRILHKPVMMPLRPPWESKHTLHTVGTLKHQGFRGCST